MKELKLPIISESITKPRILSMDEYYQFVQFNLKHVSDRKAILKEKELLRVNVPFSLR